MKFVLLLQGFAVVWNLAEIFTTRSHRIIFMSGLIFRDVAWHINQHIVPSALHIII